MNRQELLRELDLSTYIAFDFETTGLSSENDRIIEIAAIKFEGGEAVEDLLLWSILNVPLIHLSLTSQVFLMPWFQTPRSSAISSII